MRKTLSLAVVVALAVTAAPSLALGTDTQKEDRMEQALAYYLDLHRHAIDRDDLQTVEFQLPPGVDDFTAMFDWATGQVTVKSGAALGDAAGASGMEAGCTSVQVLVTPIPWANDPPAVQLCPNQLHSWGFHRTIVTCVDAFGCFTDGLNYPDFSYFFIFCGAPVTVGDDTHPGWTPTVGACAYGLFGSHPTTWTAWDSICGDTYPLGIGSCTHTDR